MPCEKQQKHHRADQNFLFFTKVMVFVGKRKEKKQETNEFLSTLKIVVIFQMKIGQNRLYISKLKFWWFEIEQLFFFNSTLNEVFLLV